MNMEYLKRLKIQQIVEIEFHFKLWSIEFVNLNKTLTLYDPF